MSNQKLSVSVQEMIWIVGRRIFTPLGGPGGVGISTFLDGLLSWLKFNRACPVSIDFSDTSRLFQRWPGAVHACPLAGKTDSEATDLILEKIHNARHESVVVLDASGAAGSRVLDAVRASSLLQLQAALSLCVTVLVFPGFDPYAGAELKAIFDECDRWVNYLVVRTPVGGGGVDWFTGSALERDLAEAAAPIIQVPRLEPYLQRELFRFEKIIGKPLSFMAALQSEDHRFGIMPRELIRQWLGRLFEQFDAIRPFLLSGAQATRGGVTPVPAYLEHLARVYPNQEYRLAKYINHTGSQSAIIG